MTKHKVQRVLPSLARCAFLVVASLVLVGAGQARSAPSSAGAPVAVLEQPAGQMPQAMHQAMLAITRAGERLVTVGERGIVLLSDDDGASWRQAQVPVSVSLTAVQFVDPDHGWIVGHMGVVLATRDGGETWIRQLEGVTAAAMVLEHAEARAEALRLGMAGTAAEDASSAGADQNDDVVEAAERALDDAQRLVEEGPDKPFLNLHFLDRNTGFVVGAYNLIFRTDDGGESWRPWQDRVPNPMGMHLYGMAGANDMLLLVGEQGTLLRSTDGGERFAVLDSPYQGSFFGVIRGPSGAFVAFGLRGNAFRSDDGGEHWTEVDTGQSEALSAGTVLADGRLVLASQAGEVLVSADEGRSFRAAPGVPPLPLADVVQAADGTVVAASLAGVHRLGRQTETER